MRLRSRSVLPARDGHRRLDRDEPEVVSQPNLDGVAYGEFRVAQLAPKADDMFSAYQPVSYDVWEYFDHGDPQYWFKRNRIWEVIGGSIGKTFGARDPANPNPSGREGAPGSPNHTCAARLSYALNHLDGARHITTGKCFHNDAVPYAGTTGDGMNYIVGASAMQEYLTTNWGPPSITLHTTDDAIMLRRRLGESRVAVFAGTEHAGMISRRLKGDEYVYSDSAVLPVSAWVLPDK
jgi:hypothetical protein